jgi:hypothetical protein
MPISGVLVLCWQYRGRSQTRRGLLQPGSDPDEVRPPLIVEDLQGLLPPLDGGWQVTSGQGGVAEPGRCRRRRT